MAWSIFCQRRWLRKKTVVRSVQGQRSATSIRIGSDQKLQWHGTSFQILLSWPWKSSSSVQKLQWWHWAEKLLCFSTKYISNNGQRALLKEMTVENRNETKWVIEWWTLWDVASNRILRDSIVLSGRFVFGTNTNDEKIAHKALFVIGQHQDARKYYILDQSQNIQPSTIRFVQTLPVIYSLYVWTADVRQEYRQSH